VWLSVQPVLASENFSNKLTTTYNVQIDGSTIIRHHFTITNKKPTITVTKQALTLSSTDIQKVKAVDDSGDSIPTTAVTTDNHTNIVVTFPEPVVGQGKSRSFTISYVDNSATVVSGQVLEVYVPKLASPDEYDSYQITINTPLQFGSPSLVNPKPTTLQQNNETFTSIFENIKDQSIIAIFGDTQVFDVSLTYHLQNNTGSRGIAQIALPPDTSFQKVHYSVLDPEPLTIDRDEDGNWLATYKLAAGTELTVTASLVAQLKLEPYTDYLSPLPSAKTTQLLEHWELPSELGQKTIAENQTPQDIYTYLTDHFEYNYDRLDKTIVRLGADYALANPDQALCQEYTDTFVALARANGISARQLTGFAYTEDDKLRPLSFIEDVLHAWPDYFDSQKNIWVQIDPTWGSTTGGIDYFNQFDLNHIVFAIHGHSSDSPYPAGSYKTPANNTDDVKVTFGTTFPEVEPKLDFSLGTFVVPSWRLPSFQKLTISNKTGQALYRQTFQLSTDSDTIILPAQLEIPYLLPYQNSSQSFQVWSESGILPQPVTLRVSYGEKINTFTIWALPKYWRWVGDPKILAGLGIGSCAFAAGAWSILVFIRRRQRLIRWQSQESQK
jgi:transglutaminase-like putative cysteine protease